MTARAAPLKNERQWRAATGLDENRFRILLTLFEKAYLDLFGTTLPERKAEGPKKSVINSTEDLLFFTLLGLKSDLSYDLLGVVTGQDGSSAKRNHDEGLKVLQTALYDNSYAPARDFKNVDDFKKCVQDFDAIIIDATEVSIERSVDYDEQKANYSGKKKDIQRRPL